MSPDIVTLGFAITKRTSGLLNGIDITHTTPFVYAERTELETKLAN